MSSRSRHTPRPLWHPALIPSWIAVGLGYALSRLPRGIQQRLGAALGRSFWRLSPSRRHVTATNLRLCFPELDEATRKEQERAVFEGLGLSAMETLSVWLGSSRRRQDFLTRTTIEGLSVLREAQAKNRGVLLIGQHLMVLDAISPALASIAPVDVIYRYNKNPVIERLMVNGRRAYFPNVIEREDARGILQSLKDGHLLWYAADQDYGARHSVFATFFGQPAATITGSARLAAFRNSPVVIMSQHRDRASGQYTLRFEAGPDNFPCGDTTADAQSINDALEATIRRTPEQYLWLHRRFKTRPEGASKVY